MSKQFKLSLLTITLLLPFTSFSQTVEQTGWVASFNSVKLSPKWGLHFDVQLRAADDLGYVRNLLVRPGLVYFINNNHNITAGYALIQTFADPDIPAAADLAEHRIWQQYVAGYKIGDIPLTHRFRLEQRFIGRPSDDVFSQRLRYFVRAIIPLNGKPKPFSKGLFAGLQNELFLNLQNKDQLNNSSFDQNRAYASFGYRINKNLDLEAGYLNQYLKGSANHVTNHVVQLAVYTRF